MEQIITDITYIHYNGEMIHGEWAINIIIGHQEFRKEKSGRILYVNEPRFYLWHKLLKEQQISFEVAARGFYEVENADIQLTTSELYDCFLQTVDTIKAIVEQKYFGGIKINPPPLEKLDVELQNFLIANRQ